ncbi:hypothetical protein FRC0190_01133 [Corynebacterium rouxii]|uniref:Uncharacterized protein n=1 Tax=Corynebacterium rouxii TaxID=2719119 RepID=A0A6I8MH90_9CORY|nr:hypothetical protein FRC0190_01133 [Corynebacterium rouxii]
MWLVGSIALWAGIGLIVLGLILAALGFVTWSAKKTQA